MTSLHGPWLLERFFLHRRAKKGGNRDIKLLNELERKLVLGKRRGKLVYNFRYAASTTPILSPSQYNFQTGGRQLTTLEKKSDASQGLNLDLWCSRPYPLGQGGGSEREDWFNCHKC